MRLGEILYMTDVHAIAADARNLHRLDVAAWAAEISFPLDRGRTVQAAVT